MLSGISTERRLTLAFVAALVVAVGALLVALLIVRDGDASAEAERCSSRGVICVSVRQASGPGLLQSDPIPVIAALATERIGVRLPGGVPRETAHIFASTSLYNRHTVAVDDDGEVRFTIELLQPGAYNFVVAQETGDEDVPTQTWAFYVSIASVPDAFGIDEGVRQELEEWLASEGLIEED